MAQQWSWRSLIRRLLIAFLTVSLIAFLPLTIFITLTISVAFRSVVKVIAAVFRPDLLEIFGGTAVVFATQSIYKQPKSNILVYLFCDKGPMPEEQFRLQFEQRVLNYTDDSGAAPYEKLAQTWTSFLGFIFWKRDSNFKLENHIRLYDYTEPELAISGKCSEDDLKRVAGDLLARPWVEGRSPWEILTVQDYRTTKGTSGSVAILRIHHAMIDGYGVRTMLLRFADSLDAKRVLPNFPKLSLTQILARNLFVLLKMPYDLAELCVDSFDGLNCWNFLWKRLSRKYHVLFSDEIDVEKMKKIRNKYSVDYNATVYAITCGAIRRVMLDAGHKLPGSLSVLVPFPLPNHPGGLAVCHASVTGFKFCPRIVSAENRFLQVGENLKSLQEYPTGPTSYGWLTQVMGLLPSCLLRNALLVLRMTVVMTSFPGPEVQIPMVGDINWTGWCCVLGTAFPTAGAIGAIMTMAGKQIITLSVDKTIFEGHEVPAKFAKFINEEVEALLTESTDVNKIKNSY